MGVIALIKCSHTIAVLIGRLKWWKRIFYWVLELSQVNAYILYSLVNQKQCTFKNFKQQLVISLCEKASLYTPKDKHKQNQV